MFRLGPFDCWPGVTGALNFNKTTRTILHKNSRFNNMDKQTGATSTFVNGLESIQHLKKKFYFWLHSEASKNYARY